MIKVSIARKLNFPSVIFEKISLEAKNGKINAAALIIKIINPLKLCKNPAERNAYHDERKHNADGISSGHDMSE